jgi:hypothetical protein
MMMKMMKNKLLYTYRLILILLIMLAGGVAFERVEADYMLVMVDLNTDVEMGHERFIAFSDCRVRGRKNQSLLRGYTRIGWYCQAMENPQ